MATKTSQGDTEFVFEDWLAEGIRGMRAKGSEKRDEIVPKEFRVHMRAAKKEFLTALRSLVDAALKKVEAEPEAPKKATKIKVE